MAVSSTTMLDTLRLNGEIKMVTRLGLTAIPDTKIYLKEWREAKGWTQQELADRMETTKATVSRVENGTRDWSKGYLESMAHLIGCQVTDLFRNPLQSDPPIRGDRQILEVLQKIEGLDQRGVEVVFSVIDTVIQRQPAKSEPSSSDDQPEISKPLRELKP